MTSESVVGEPKTRKGRRFVPLGPVMVARITQIFASPAKKAEVPPITLHGLRHTHATLAFAAGVHPKVVSERPGTPRCPSP